MARDVRTEVAETDPTPAFVAGRPGVAPLPRLLVPPTPYVTAVPLHEGTDQDFDVIVGASPGETASALLEDLLAAYRAAAVAYDHGAETGGERRTVFVEPPRRIIAS